MTRYSRIFSCTLYGISGVKVEIEVSIMPGLSSFEIVGLGDSAIRESRDRVHAAIKNSGYEFPGGKITVGMAPAFIHKTGSAYDLPIAIGVLVASRQISAVPDNICIAGEMSLNGEVRKIPGVINRILTASGEGFLKMIVPYENIGEGIGIDNISLYGVRSIVECVDLLKNKGAWPLQSIEYTSSRIEEKAYRDISSIIGQPMAVWALQIAAAGRHNLLMSGSPGCGKTSIASILPGILPSLERDEKIDVAKIYSSCSLLKQGEPLTETRPFRAPHHSATPASMAGGGIYPSPGEMTLAHTGVLFLDEMNEFSPAVLDMLRQPMEEHIIRLTRNKYSVEYPADFMLVGAVNPCKCGNLLERDIRFPCRCSPAMIEKYFNSISGPLIDRIDMYVELFKVASTLLQGSIQDSGVKNSPDMRQRVKNAWAKQYERCARHNINPQLNSRIPANLITEVFEIDDNFTQYTQSAIDRLGLSVRSYQKLIRVARTIADYEESVKLTSEHFAKAIRFRRNHN